MNWPRVYLASQSPRRRELLTQIGVDFQVLPVSVDEATEAAEPAADYVCRIARLKASAGAQLVVREQQVRPVLAADTAVVTAAGEILGKPRSDDEARDMLDALSGTCHQVLTAVALWQGDSQEVCLQHNRVFFDVLSPADIEALIATGEGQDKAGSYGIQASAAAFIKHIEGSYSGIMGLPLFETAQLLRRATTML